MQNIEIRSVKIQGEGFLLNSEMSVPKADGNLEYEAIKEWLKKNTPEPEFTDDELQQQIQYISDQEASKARDEAMLKGFVYNGMDISVTKDDGDGMVQVKASFELGLTSTVIHFSNGSKLPMSAEEFPAFALQFVTERGKFFS